MDKKRLDRVNSFGFPMPVVLIGAVVDGRPTCLTAAWVMPVEMEPPMLAAALAPHHTNLGIEAHGEFSINVPGRSMAAAVDYCGTVSGTRIDKSRLFTYFYGDLPYAPMIDECPFTIACRLVDSFKVRRHTVYIGEAVGVYAESSRVRNGRAVGCDLDALLLSGSDRSYVAPGEMLGKGWSIGKATFAHVQASPEGDTL